MPLVFYRPEREQLQAQSASNRQGRAGEPLDALYEEAIARWETLRREASSGYEWLVGRDVARELARIDLPLSLYTQWYWKIDLHNLLHFLSLRADPHAQYEIRAYARVVAGMLQRVAPLTFEAWMDYEVGGAHLSRGELAALRRLLRVRDGGLEAAPGRIDRESSRASACRPARSTSCWRSWTPPRRRRTSPSICRRPGRGSISRSGWRPPFHASIGRDDRRATRRAHGRPARCPPLQRRALHERARDLGGRLA